MSRIRERITYANAMSTIAVFAVLGGGAYAASELDKNEVKSKHIKTGAVKNADLADNAVTSPKVANGSLQSQDFGAGQLPQGPQGPAGPQGPSGIGPAFGAFRDEDVPIEACNACNATLTRIATLSAIPAGVYAITAKTVISATSGSGADVECRLRAPAGGGGDVDTSYSTVSTAAPAYPNETVNLQLLHEFPTAGGEVDLVCTKVGASQSALAELTKIQAIRLTSATNAAVGG